jgi:hypothetical protein
VATGARRFLSGVWWHGRRCYGWWVGVVPTIGLIEDVGWLDAVS